MKVHSLFKGLSWLLVLNLAIKPLWIFFIDRQVQNQVGHEAYGSYFAAFNLCYVLAFIADIGISNMMNQRLANQQTVNATYYLKFKLLLCVAYVLFTCFVAWITKLKEWDLLLFVIGIQVLTSLFVFLRSLVTAHQHFTTDAFFSVLDKTLMVVLCAGFIYFPLAFGTITLLLFLKVQLLCTAFAVLAAFAFVIKKQLLSSGSKEDIASLIKSTAPFAAIILLMSMHYRLDGFLLERIHTNGAYEAGIYASAYRLLDAGNMVGYLAASFLVPFVARHQLQKKVAEEAIVTTRHGLLFFGIGVACFSVLFAPWIQQLLYHTHTVYNTQVIQLCMAALPAYLLMHVYGSVLTATARFRPLILILVISVAINVLLNSFLIPSYGAMGCCMAALASHYFCALACYVVATKTLQLSFTLKSNLLYLATAAALCLFLYWGRNAMLNVWLILVLAIGFVLLVLAVQISFVRKYFIALH